MNLSFRTAAAVLTVAASALSAALPATAQTTSPTITTARAASTRPARLDYRTTTLPNGLKVITLEDHRAPVVTLQVWYRVGSKDEAKGKAGFAHLFEHLLFKGSKNVGPEEHGRLIEQIGGDYNADTFFDRTRYYETVPANALDRILWLEADRMASLRVTEANLRSERDVVKEEHRTNVGNAPYGTLFEKVQALLFSPSHPYAHTTIGLLEDLDSARLAEVKAFHAAYYKPDNATLVLVGDFRTADALARIRHYYGAIPRSRKPFLRYPAPPIRQTAERRAVWYDRLAPLPAVGMAFRLPPAGSPDTPALAVIEQILSEGQSSRLYRSLVRDKQIAVSASGGALSLKLSGIFFFFATGNAGVEPKTIEQALREQVTRLRDEPVSADELRKAKNQVLTGEVFGTLSTEQKASALGEADLLHGTPDEVNRAYDKIAAVTAADVRRVARKYFAPAGSNVFYMLPEAMRPAKRAAAAAVPTEKP